MNRCPLCETMPPHHDRDCPAGYVERLQLFTPSSLLMRRLLLLAADNSQDWQKLMVLYQNHSGETLEELLYFAGMAENTFTKIRKAIAVTIEQSRMPSSTIGKPMPDQRAVPSSLSPEGSNGAQSVSTVTKSRALLFSELTGPIDPRARIKAAEDLGMPLVAAYLRGRLLKSDKSPDPLCSETLEIAKQAAQHRQQGG